MSTPSLAHLRTLKRVELQALCKENSLRANLKNEELIKSLAEHYKSVGQNETPVNDKTEVTTSTVKEQTKPAAKRVEEASSEEELRGNSSSSASSLSARLKGQVDALAADFAAFRDEFARSAQAIPTIVNDEIAKVNNSHRTLIGSVLARLETRMTNLKTALDEEVEGLQAQVDAGRVERASVSSELAELKTKVSKLEELQVRGLEERGRQYQEGQNRSREIEQRMEERLRALEMAESERAEKERLREQEAEVERPAHEPSGAQPQFSPAVGFASPTFSDAPPTRSLISFDSPVASPAPGIQSTPRHGPFASTSTHKATPFRFGSDSATNSAPTPVSALPPHMIASTARHSPRSSSAAEPVPAPQPRSPAAAVPNASLGKRARDSDASNLSIGLEAVVSPVRRVGTEGGRPSTPFTATVTTPKDAGHSRKKLRMSVREDDDIFETPGGNIASGHEDEEEEEEEDPEIENSSDSVRDYLMPTKTGDSPATALRPVTLVSTSDPTFFSAPASPARSTPGRRSMSHINENQTPATAANVPRKSLPVSDLPFPLVSPFATKTRPAPSFGTPATTALGNLSNQGFTNLLKSTSKSASKLSVPKPRLLPPRTPPASRTLFGTERFPFSDGLEEESRFNDDGFETAEEDTTGIEQTWSKFGGGAFSRV